MAAGTYDICAGSPPYSPEKFSVAEAVLDFTVDTGATGETIDVMTIPVNTVVVAFTIQCKTAEGAALTIDVGTGAGAAASPTRFANNFNCNSATVATAVTTPYACMTAADKVQVLINNSGANTGCVIFKAVMVSMADMLDSY